MEVTIKSKISIHALREESDLLHEVNRLHHVRISIHALREESDYGLVLRLARSRIFQSTLSVRRATVQLDIFVRFLRHKPAA